MPLKESCEDVEWMDDDDINVTNCESVVVDKPEESDLAVVSMDKYFNCLWSNNYYGRYMYACIDLSIKQFAILQLMAFAGTFVSQIKFVIHEKSKLTSTTQSAFRLFNEDTSSNDRSSSSSVDRRPTHNNSIDYIAANYPGVLDSELASLTTAQRHIFIPILIILCVLSLCGNVGTLFVNFRRKIRPFFRACLISLALSDLMNTVFLTTSYLSLFTADFVQIWRLGDVMCSLVPFATTCAILASSMTLVGIALDRYFAVMKAVIGFWNPSVISCIACMLCIWLAAISIACPAFAFYDLQPMYILTQEQETATSTEGPAIITTTAEEAKINASTLLKARNVSVFMAPRKANIPIKGNMPKSAKATVNFIANARTIGIQLPWEREDSLENLPDEYTLVRTQKLVNMCMSDQKNVSVYFVIVFFIIFVPCIVAFFWFNSIIAKKLWKRRHMAAITKRRNLETGNGPKPEIITPTTNAESTKAEPPKRILLTNQPCNCKSGPTSSSTVPSSVANTLCGNVSKSAGTNSNSPSCNLNATTNNTREARHIRMFIIILLMMAVFVFLRLPAWIFLLMRMYGNYTEPRCWVLYFIFGLMNLTSSVLNPVFYTFLSETVQCVLKCKTKVASLLCGSCIKYETAAHSAFCRGGAFLCWHKTSFGHDYNYNAQTYSVQQESEQRSKDSLSVGNNEKDEGVDCNDEIGEAEVCSVNDYNHRIFTIYPSSLVSSSIHSEN